MYAAMDSLYRWWWECLKESAEYDEALRGKLGQPWAGMAADFGELEDSFSDWWMVRGRGLLGDQVYQPAVLRLSSAAEFVKDDVRPNMLLEVPLTTSRKEIIKQFTQLLDEALVKRPERSARGSGIRRELYPDQRMRLETIKSLLEVWKARKGADDEAWWQTGERLGHWTQYHSLPNDDAAAIKEKQRLMTLTVQRLHRMATALIDFAAKGDFPRVK